MEGALRAILGRAGRKSRRTLPKTAAPRNGGWPLIEPGYVVILDIGFRLLDGDIARLGLLDDHAPERGEGLSLDAVVVMPQASPLQGLAAVEEGLPHHN